MLQQSAYIHSKWRLRAPCVVQLHHATYRSSRPFLSHSPRGILPQGAIPKVKILVFWKGLSPPYATFALKAVSLLQFKRDILSWLSGVIDTGNSVKCMGIYKPLLTVKVKRGGIIHRHVRPDSTLNSRACMYVWYHTLKYWQTSNTYGLGQ
jgi:hypothetical protein